MAKPPTVVGKANQNASGKNINNKMITVKEAKNSIQYGAFDFFSDIAM